MVDYANTNGSGHKRMLLPPPEGDPDPTSDLFCHGLEWSIVIVQENVTCHDAAPVMIQL
jgi:hypothetical protein